MDSEPKRVPYPLFEYVPGPTFNLRPRVKCPVCKEVFANLSAHFSEQLDDAHVIASVLAT